MVPSCMCIKTGSWKELGIGILTNDLSTLYKEDTLKYKIVSSSAVAAALCMSSTVCGLFRVLYRR